MIAAIVMVFKSGSYIIPAMLNLRFFSISRQTSFPSNAMQATYGILSRNRTQAISLWEVRVTCITTARATPARSSWIENTQFSHHVAIVISNLTPLFAPAIRNSGYYELTKRFMVPTANLIVLPLTNRLWAKLFNVQTQIKKNPFVLLYRYLLIGLLGWINDSFVAL